jgi:putative tricarboxylic transport membrane protein
MGRAEPLLNVFWIVLGVATCAYSWSVGITGPMGPGSGFFPALAGLLIAGGGSLLLLPGAARVPAARVFWPEGRASSRAVLTIVVIIGLTIVAIPYLGFLLANLVAMPILVRAIGKSRWWVAVIVGIVSVGCVSYLFDTLLGVTLPRGPFGF